MPRSLTHSADVGGPPDAAKPSPAGKPCAGGKLDAGWTAAPALPAVTPATPGRAQAAAAAKTRNLLRALIRTSCGKVPWAAYPETSLRPPASPHRGHPPFSDKD